jgi:hypothetical protein
MFKYRYRYLPDDNHNFHQPWSSSGNSRLRIVFYVFVPSGTAPGVEYRRASVVSHK